MAPLTSVGKRLCIFNVLDTLEALMILVASKIMYSPLLKVINRVQRPVSYMGTGRGALGMTGWGCI